MCVDSQKEILALPFPGGFMFIGRVKKKNSKMSVQKAFSLIEKLNC